MPRWIRFRTAHDTLVIARCDAGRLLHAIDGAADGHADIIGFVSSDHPDLCFLAAAGPLGLALAAEGGGMPRAVLACRIVPTESKGRVALQVPHTGKFLCALPLDRPDRSAEVIASRSSVGGWETFTLEPQEVTIVPDALAALIQAGIEACRIGTDLTDRAFLWHLIRPNDAALLAVFIALIPIIPDADLRAMIPELAGMPCYASLFDFIQPRLAGNDSVFHYNTARAFVSQITRSGWRIGAHSYGHPEIVDGEYGHLTIGRYCSIAGQVKIILANHAIDRVTTYPFKALGEFWPNAVEADDDHASGDVVIGHGVWIGTGVCVVPGTRIGDGSVIGAQAVARGTIPPYSVVVGNPGRVVRRLFDDETITRLLAVAWWNWPDWKVDRFVPQLLNADIHAFLDAAEQSAA